MAPMTLALEPAQPGLLLHDRRFLQYLSSRVLSTIAYQMLSVAVGWQIYALTGSPFFLGLVGLAQFLPMFLLTLIVGHVADRYDRLSILRVCRLVQGAGALALAAASYSGSLGKEGILAVVLVIGAARAFETPTQAALMPGLVPGALFSRAVAWATSLTQTAFIVGPALGGLFYAAGVTLVYGIITSLWLASGLLVSLIRMERKIVKPEPVSLRSLFAGIAFIRSRPAIFGAISLDLFAVLLGGATALLPVYAQHILAVGPAGLGLLRSAPAAGALLMSLFLARYPLMRRMGRTMFTAVFVFGAATVVFALSSSFPLSLVSSGDPRGGGRDQRGHQAIPRADGDARCHEGEGERRQFDVRRHFQPTGGIRVGRHRGVVRGRARRADRGHRHHDRRGDLDASLPRPCPLRPPETIENIASSEDERAAVKRCDTA